MRPGLGSGEAMGALLQGAIPGRCPACRRHSMFRGWLDLYERCPVCGVRYAVESGAWLGAIAVGYGIAALVAVALTVIEVLAHPISRAGLDPIWTITIVGIAATVLAYRPAKGLWFALLWVYGFTEDATKPGD
jgi:uncharacterized protein (DUF983 family)